MQEPVVSPESLRAALRLHQQGHHAGAAAAPTLSALGMSLQVAESFASAVGDKERLHLAALRSEDRYDIEMRIGDVPPTYKEMGRLSGGAQVSILLSLILEADDSNPLVIDQPEDEIDKEFLFETVLPALRRLKGRRQVVLATHDANIVVNGDADQVIQLKAVADAGHVAVQGVIEMRGVRDAIVATLDGGRDAFALRQAKYGF